MKASITAGFAAMALLATSPPAAAGEREPGELLAVAKATYPGEFCWWERAEENADSIAAHTLAFRHDYDEADDPERSVTIYEVPCFFGAYNFGSVWFIDREYEGLVPLHFAAPVVDVTYADEDSEILESMTVVGFASHAAVVNSHFDEDSGAITSFSKWRGLGDAASSGTWTFRDGGFLLTHFTVDPTFDGEINPVTVYSAEPE